MRKLVIGLAIGLSLGAIGVARAAIPDAGGVIHGCYKTAAPHALRVVDSERRLVNGRWVREVCLSDETSLNWNQR